MFFLALLRERALPFGQIAPDRSHFGYDLLTPWPEWLSLPFPLHRIIFYRRSLGSIARPLPYDLRSDMRYFIAAPYPGLGFQHPPYFFFSAELLQSWRAPVNGVDLSKAGIVLQLCWRLLPSYDLGVRGSKSASIAQRGCDSCPITAVGSGHLHFS